MALAYLNYEESDGENRRFQIDLGSNRYYAYAIGGGEPLKRNGIALLASPQYESGVLGPIESDDGRDELLVPEHRFSRDNRFIQLQSFRERDGTGPAVSAILETDPGDRDAPGEPEERTHLMGRPLALTLAPAPHRGPSPVSRPRRRRCRISETKSLSNAMFIDALVSMLPQLLPAAGGLLGSLLGGAPATNGASAPAPAWIGQLTSFLQQLLSQSSPPAAAPARPAPAPVPPSPVLTASLSRSQLQYSEAMFAPALLAALPALMPLLQSVLSPQTIQGVLQTADPNRLIGSVSNAINSFAQLGMQNDEAQRAHLRALNPGVDDSALMALLGSLSANLEEVHAERPRYRRTDRATLHFADTSTVALGGQQVLAYVTDNGLQFPLSLETPKAIPAGWMRVTIRNAETLDRIARFRVKTPPLSEGRISLMPEFKAEELHAIQSGHDYLVKAELIWKNKSGDRIGTTTTQTIRAIGQFTFDSVQEGKIIVPLNDVDKFRDFWHKVWQDSFSREVARREYEVKYYYVLKPELTSNEQAQTELKEKFEGIRKATGRMKAGLLLSPNRLNELLPQLASQPVLGEAELKALLDPRFIERMSLAARYHVKFGGPPERPAALWVFPEVKVQRVLLRQAEKVDDSGHVVTMTDREVNFPIPVLIHFVGVEGE